MRTWVKRIWHTSSMLPIQRSTNSHTWRHWRCHVCPCLKKWTCWMERMMVHEFHYKLISTWLMKTKSLLLMWWLLTRHERRWLRVSLIDQQVQLQNLMPLLKSTNIEGFMKNIILFQWPWMCTVHPCVIWIISLRSVLVTHVWYGSFH